MERSSFVRYYWGSQLAQHIGIGDSTLRKWAIALEKAGYIFERDEHGNRAYSDGDVIVIRALKEHLATRMKLEDAANVVAEKYKKNAEENEVTDVVTGTMGRENGVLDDTVKAQFEALKELLDQRDKRVFEVLSQWERERQNQQEQMNQMAQVLQQIQQTQLQLAAAQEKKKPWWKHLFG